MMRGQRTRVCEQESIDRWASARGKKIGLILRNQISFLISLAKGTKQTAANEEGI